MPTRDGYPWRADDAALPPRKLVRMVRAQTGRAGLKHVIVRNPPVQEERKQDNVPEVEGSVRIELPSPGDRWRCPVFSGSEYTPMWVRQRTWEAHPETVAQTRAL